MYSKRLARCVLFAGALGLAILVGTAPASGGQGGTKGARVAETPNDTGWVGDVTVGPGETALVPITIKTDDALTAIDFHFEFDEVEWGALAFIEAVPGPDMDDTTQFDASIDGGVLTVTTTTDPISVVTDGSAPFIYLKFSTCATFASGEKVKWNPGESLIGTSGGLEFIDDEFDGSVEIDQATFDLAIGDIDGLLGEEVWVPIIVDNSDDFEYFWLGTYFDLSKLEFVRAEPTSRTNPDNWTLQYYGSNLALLRETNTDGFGVPDDDPEVPDTLFYFVFRVLTDDDDWSTTLTFVDPVTTFHRLGCGTVFGSLGTVTKDNGSVTVPKYVVTFSAGDAIGSTGCPVSVPLYVESNFPIYSLQMIVKYNDDWGNDPLRFIGVTQPNPYDISSPFPRHCDSGGGEFGYMELSNNAGTVVGVAETPLQIAELNFENEWAPDEAVDYVLHALNDACGLLGKDSWVQAAKILGGGYEASSLVLDYVDGDPTSAVQWGDGTISVPSGLVHVNVPSAGPTFCKWPPCPSRVRTTIGLNSAVDLETLTFRVTWEDDVCVNIYGLTSGVSVSQSGTHADVTAIDITGTGVWRTLATMQFYNKSGGNQSGPIGVDNMAVVQSDPCVDPVLLGTGGTYRVNSNVASCAVIIHHDLPYDLRIGGLPAQFGLAQNRPNPFNASTVIEFSLAEAGNTRLDVYNVMGQRVATLMDAFTEAGPYSLIWDATDESGAPIASGMYFYRLTSGTNIETKKMMILK